MSSAREYAVVLALRAKDMATGTIRAVTGRLAAIRGQISALGREHLGTGRVISAVASLRGAVGDVSGHVRGVLAPALAFLSAATGGGILALTHKVANAGDALGEMADRLGVHVETLQEYQFAAMRSGASNEQLETGFKELTKRIGEAVNGTGEAKDVFAALGIKLKDQFGNVYSSAAVMGMLAEKMTDIPNAAERAAVASALLGKQGYMLAPMLAKGTEGLAKAAEEARKFGVMTEAQVKASGAFMDSVDDAGKAATGMANAVGSRLLPLIQPLIDRVTNWVVANRELVAGRVEQFVNRLAAGLDTVDIGRLVDGVFRFVEGAASAVEMIGGWGMALGGLGLIMAAGPLLATAQLIGAVVNLGIAITITAAKWGLLAGAGVVGMIATFRKELQTGVGVVRALNIALAANPVGAIVAGITLLVGLGITLYNTWQPFREMVDAIVAKVLELAKAGGKWVAEKLGITIGGEKSANMPSPDYGYQDYGAFVEGARKDNVARQVALTTPAMTLPPAGGSHQSAKIEVEVKAAPGTNAQVVSERQNGPGNMNISTDLAVGMGWAAG